MSDLTGLTDTLTAHPRIARIRAICEHVHFDDDSSVVIRTVLEQQPDWPDRMWLDVEIDRVLLDDTDSLTSYILKLADDWVVDGAPA